MTTATPAKHVPHDRVMQAIDDARDEAPTRRGVRRRLSLVTTDHRLRAGPSVDVVAI